MFGFGWREQKEKAYQEIAIFPEFLLGKVPPGIPLHEAVTVPNNFVTIFQAAEANLGISLPWPKPHDYVPAGADDAFLIWGGSSSVGQYATQIFAYYGYRNVQATASAKHHGMLKKLGAQQVFDYRDADVVQSIKSANQSSKTGKPAIRYIFDCIGSKDGSLAHISKIAEAGTTVAVVLPVVIRDASETEAPEYAMDPAEEAQWADGVELSGVRAHFYLNVSCTIGC